MNIFWKEMRSGLRSLLIWGIGVALFIGASMQKYAALSTDPAALNIFFQLPAALKDVFGVGYLDFAKISGFYGMIYPYLLLMASIHASMAGAVILSKEERDRTGEFLYAKPASRAGILTAKLMAALAAAAAFNLMTWAISSGMTAAFGGGEDMGGTLARLMAGLFLIQLVFLALGVASAAMFTRPRAATGIATGALLAAYLLSIGIDVSRKIDLLKPLTPFSYFDARRIVGRGEGLDPGRVALCLLLSAALIAASYLRFNRRDLRL